ncbi:MAG: hypothetical protein L3K13_02255 [Thermoplasmata archaeon]|nr:hypothetical protein [Thermoplasmata archaeon]
MDLLAPGPCQTRFLKTARFLQRTVPDLLPPSEPVEGFRSILDGSDPSMRYLLRDALAHGKLPRLRSEPVSKGLVGSLLVLRPTFQTRKGPFAVGPEDTEQIALYLTRVAPLLERYLAPFVKVELTPAPVVHEMAVALASNRFCDSQVAEWVNRVVATTPEAAGCVVLAPPSVVNSDAEGSSGARGYHASARLPYLFLNVRGSGLRLDDPSDSFALALGHQLLEMASDPGADAENPEICDPCAPTEARACRNYFGREGQYLGSRSEFPPDIEYAYFLHGVPRPGTPLTRASTLGECGYAPPSVAGER